MFDLKSKVLVVDDMMMMRKLVTKVCKEIGFIDVTDAPDGDRAWKTICEAKPAFDLVISDWNMPVCSGLELLKRIRGDKRFAHLPFVMVTAEAEKHQIIEALKAGVTNYVIKPFTADDLRQKLETAHAKVSAQPKKASA